MKKIILLFLNTLLLPLSIGSTGKNVLITGASRGVGFETAKLFADRGYTVYGVVRESSIVPSNRENIRWIAVDYRNEASILNAVEKIQQEVQQIDILINNAGYALIGPVETLYDDQIKDQMEVNFFAPVRFCKAVLPMMREQNCGRIVNISSVNAILSLPYGSMYAASKAALEAFSEALSEEARSFNIDVSILQPGPLTTDFKLIIGESSVPKSPYQELMKKIQVAIDERLNHPVFEKYGQSAKEIAEIIFNIS
ncbi:MAG: SDR family oxidoreductase, partial [Chlamydiae bacterium]|nr:SDR family oxidoreductase [Chlamydiota bacterium]